MLELSAIFKLAKKFDAGSGLGVLLYVRFWSVSAVQHSITSTAALECKADIQQRFCDSQNPTGSFCRDRLFNQSDLYFRDGQQSAKSGRTNLLFHTHDG